jgi:imidazole glycerol-phosphate synthase subunit HisH
MIKIIDYSMGNIGSIVNMFKRIDVEVSRATTINDIRMANKLILPGVGAFDQGMENLRRMGIVEALNEEVLERRKPILGLCLGMQLFSRGSEEGQSAGLGWIDAYTVRFRPSEIHYDLKVPHMGWNVLYPCKTHPILADLNPRSRFYFVHSFHVKCNDRSDVLAQSYYGEEFDAGLARGSIIGLQFHPEKSLKWGMAILRRFAEDAPV